MVFHIIIFILAYLNKFPCNTNDAKYALLIKIIDPSESEVLS